MGIMNTAANVIWGAIRRKQHHQYFSDSEYQEVKDSIQVLTGIEKFELKQDAISNYEQNRATGVNNFSDVKGPNGQEIFKKPKEGDFNNALANVFNKQDQLDKIAAIKTGYKSEMDEINKIRDEIGSKYLPGDLINKLKAVQKVTADNVKERQQEEISDLEAIFTNEAAKQSLKTQYSIENDRDIEALKTSMVESLKSKHSKENAELDKEFSNNIKTICDAAQQQDTTMRYITLLAANNSQMKRNLEEAQEKKWRELHAAEAAALGTDDPIPYAEIPVSLKDVATEVRQGVYELYTPGGNTIKWSQKDGQNCFELKTGWMRKSIFMNLVNPKYNLKGDFRALAEAVKATGSKTVHFNVDIKNQELAQQRAKECIEAALEAGFKLEDISVKVNGKEYKYDKEKGAVQSFEGIITYNEVERSQKIGQAEAAQDTSKNTSESGQKYIKDRIQEIRSENASTTPEVQPEALTPISPN